eukprot:TRINITY_DN122168_c0_g1_i1.p1 TRINITY_DN122168_c0_g1~~TRINITY_DN122168_c0_g1_i1.p1  ORF type:complete len:601 (-),score=147.98 TRINITY_DN122168_c0_g1_i1:153-1955(-)
MTVSHCTPPLSGCAASLPDELLPYASLCFARFPEVLLALGKPSLVQDFELPPSKGSLLVVEDTGDARVVQVVLRRKSAGEECEGGGAPWWSTVPASHLEPNWRPPRLIEQFKARTTKHSARPEAATAEPALQGRNRVSDAAPAAPLAANLVANLPGNLVSSMQLVNGRNSGDDHRPPLAFSREGSLRSAAAPPDAAANHAPPSRRPPLYGAGNDVCEDKEANELLDGLPFAAAGTWLTPAAPPAQVQSGWDTGCGFAAGWQPPLSQTAQQERLYEQQRRGYDNSGASSPQKPQRQPQQRAEQQHLRQQMDTKGRGFRDQPPLQQQKQRQQPALRQQTQPQQPQQQHASPPQLQMQQAAGQHRKELQEMMLHHVQEEEHLQQYVLQEMLLETSHGSQLSTLLEEELPAGFQQQERLPAGFQPQAQEQRVRMAPDQENMQRCLDPLPLPVRSACHQAAEQSQQLQPQAHAAVAASNGIAPRSTEAPPAHPVQPSSQTLPQQMNRSTANGVGASEDPPFQVTLSSKGEGKADDAPARSPSVQSGSGKSNNTNSTTPKGTQVKKEKETKSKKNNPSRKQRGYEEPASPRSPGTYQPWGKNDKGA